MRISFKHWVPLGLFVVVAIILWQGLRHDPHHLQSPLIGEHLPTFKLQGLVRKEKVWQPNSWQGKVVVLNVFASWCVSCQIEHPTLVDLAKDTDVVWVGLDYMDQAKDALSYLRKHGNPYAAVLFDPAGRLPVNLGVYGVPETFIIDRSGVIRFKRVGPISHEIWQNKLLPIVQRLAR